MRTEENYEDVLQNLEYAIVELFRRRPELLDYDVDAALEWLVARYVAELRGRDPREAPAGIRGELAAEVAVVCEWRLGRREMPGVPPVEPLLPIEALLECLKRLRKSVRRWNREGGRRGYLTFVQRFLP